MTPSPVWSMFAYRHDDEEGAHDHYRQVAEWRVEDAFRWARYRGYDTIVFSRAGSREYREPSPARGITSNPVT